MDTNSTNLNNELKQLDNFVNKNCGIFLDENTVLKMVIPQDKTSRQIIDITAEIKAYKDCQFFAKKQFTSKRIEFETYY